MEFKGSGIPLRSSSKKRPCSSPKIRRGIAAISLLSTDGLLYKKVDNFLVLFYIRYNSTYHGDKMNVLKLSTLWVLLIFSSAPLLVSCKAPSIKALPQLEVKGEKSPERIKRIINERLRSIQTVEGHLTIISKGGPSPGRCKAVLFFKRPSQFRLKGYQAFGPTLFDILMEESFIQVYIPEQNKVFKTDVNEGTKRQSPGLTPLDLLKGIFQVGIDESEELSLSQSPPGDIVLNHLKKGRLVKKTEIDSQSLFIKKETFIGAWEQPYLITSYSEYEKIDEQWWPFRIELQQPMEGQFMTFEFQTVRANGPIERDVFKLDVPPGVITVHQ
jgi:outer membrane lipoprotein-sorting protein